MRRVILDAVRRASSASMRASTPRWRSTALGVERANPTSAPPLFPPLAGSRLRAAPASHGSLAEFIRRCCEDVGRGDDADTIAAVTEALRVNKYRRPDDLTTFSEKKAMEVGVPLRLATAMRKRLSGAGMGVDDALKAVPKPEPVATEPQATAKSMFPTLREMEEEASRRKDARMEANDEAAKMNEANASTTEFLLPDAPPARCAPMRVDSHGNVTGTRATRRPDKTSMADYRLRRDEMPSSLIDELDALKRFLTVRRLGAADEPIKEITAAKYEDQLRGLLGWMRSHVKPGFPIEKLTSLKAAFPTPDRRGAQLAFEHIQWLVNTRKCSANYELVALRAFIAAAKFVHGGDEDDMGSNDGLDKPYAKLGLVQQLRKIAKETGRRAERESSVSDARVKWLDWSQYLGVVDALRGECAPLDKDGRARSPSAVAWSAQRYLIFGILSCVPDRQRTVRELEIGRTLFKEHAKGKGGSNSANTTNDSDDYNSNDSDSSVNGGEYRWVIRHGPDDYKTGRDYGVRPPMVIHPKFYPMLEDFVENQRRHLGDPEHGMLFSTRSGAPLRDKDVHRILTSTSYRLTGKRVNPHLVRDMIITHLRGTDASERELEALAIYMGHSLAMQKGTYDRRTKEEKVAPAIDLLESVNAKMRL